LVPIECRCRCGQDQVATVTTDCQRTGDICCRRACDTTLTFDLTYTTRDSCGRPGTRTERQHLRCQYDGSWQIPDVPNPSPTCIGFGYSKANCLTFCSESFTTCMEVAIVSCFLTGPAYLNCVTTAGVACQIGYGSICQRNCNQCPNP